VVTVKEKMILPPSKVVPHTHTHTAQSHSCYVGNV
jgi:hypothetical protein